MVNPALDVVASRVETLPAIFHRYRAPISEGLHDSLSGDDLAVYEILRYSMGWSDERGNPTVATGGKALRPTLCLLACEASGGSIGNALPAAVSLELIHNFSLIHDDIQDGDRTRHHRPTVWAKWGKPKALVAGNILRVVADTSLWGLVAGSTGQRQSLDVTGLLTEAYLQMIEGQYLDLSYEGRRDIGMTDYLNMIERKTGALIRCSMQIGTLLATDDERAVKAFRDCGRALGYVFQVRDDVLGIWGEEQATGKPVGADIRRRKNSLPIVHAMSAADGLDRELLLSVYGRENVTPEDASRVMDVMERVNTQKFAQDLAAEHYEVALEALSSVEIAADTRRDLEKVAHFLLVREH